jgi:hypothetical protein
MKDKFTLIIQGPLHKNCIKGINENYFNFVDCIILSFWDTDNLKLLEEIDPSLINNKKLILQKNSFHIDPNAFNQDNIYYQVYTTLKGLKKSNTEYSIKIRCDQWYENLSPILECVLQNDNKFVCSNQHFRPDFLYKYHAGDNIIGMKTQDLLNTFQTCYDRLTKNAFVLLSGAYMYTDNQELLTPKLFQKYIQYKRNNLEFITKHDDKPILHTVKILRDYGIGIAPEQMIATSYLISKNILPIPENSKSIVKDNFFIFKVEDLGGHLNKHNVNTVLRNDAVEIHDINDY